MTHPPDALLLAVADLGVSLQTASSRVTALRNVDFSIGRGATLGLIGESGCGKSTTALAIMGLLPANAALSGSIKLGGQELIKLPDSAMSVLRGNRIAMVFQEPMTALNPLHTVGDQIAEPLRVHRAMPRRAAQAEALRLLDRVRMPQAAQRLNAYPHQLSGGQRQRVSIAMALACGPDLLIADEPTTALDATIQREILDLIAELVAERGMALLMISHDLGVMARTATRVLVMYAGSIVESGPTADVFARPAHPYTKGLLKARPSLATPRIDGRKPRLDTIPGRVPDLADLPTGCAFADRCPSAIAACRLQFPEMARAGPDHSARCIRLNTLPP